MIKGKQKEQNVYLDKPTVDYRKLDALNQSMLKVFDSDPIRFFEEFKMGKKRKDKKSTSLSIGDLVDFFLLECRGDQQEFENRFDEKFALFNGTKGTGQVFTLVDHLFAITEGCLDEENRITVSFEERFKDAFARTQADGKYKGKTIEKVMEDFNENGLDYFQTCLNSIGRTVVDISLVDKAKTVANNILTDPFTRELFYQNDDIEVFTHFPIEWKYKVGEGKFITCKSEIDRLEINHTKKTIQVDDLKTTYDNESFDYMYIKNSYYLQNTFYGMAVTWWALQEKLDYKVLPMRFIVGDTSANNRRPLIYTTTQKDFNNGWVGFMLRGNKYRGVKELVTDIVWAEDNDMWTCSKEAYDKQGQLPLNVNYDDTKN